MKLAIIGATAAAFAAVALATAPMASADPEERFLTNLEVAGFSWADEAGGQALIDNGYGICQELDQGASAADMVMEGVDATGWTGTQVGYFVGAAASAFCPEHLERAIAEASTLGG